MIIKRILNHNAVIAQSKKDIDILLFGRGIAFGRKIGDKVNPIDIEKSFFLKNRDNMTRFTEMFINVPLELVYITEKIINLGKITLGNNFDEIIYINLTDHISSSIELIKKELLFRIPYAGKSRNIIKKNLSLGKGLYK
ncbi:transcription antiterminator LicT [Streptococcus pneumoniae]|nr:transcription antiterminator LicT [Streptococcus pneumoniae]